MNDWKVLTTEEFDEELIEILQYIQEELAMPETGFKQFLRIEETVLGLKVMPERNPIHNQELNVRKAIVDNYVVFYQVYVERKEVIALHVFYGGRNIDELI